VRSTQRLSARQPVHIDPAVVGWHENFASADDGDVELWICEGEVPLLAIPEDLDLLASAERTGDEVFRVVAEKRPSSIKSGSQKNMLGFSGFIRGSGAYSIDEILARSFGAGKTEAMASS
jgi:hypothetical protein